MFDVLKLIARNVRTMVFRMQSLAGKVGDTPGTGRLSAVACDPMIRGATTFSQEMGSALHQKKLDEEQTADKVHGFMVWFVEAAWPPTISCVWQEALATLLAQAGRKAC